MKQCFRCRRNKLLHVLFLGAILLLLAACSGSTTTTPGKTPTARAATATAKPSTVPSGTVLYQADSSRLNSWHGTTGWKLVHGFLQSDLSNDNVLISPYVPTVPNYAVEVHFQIVSVPQGGGYFAVTAEQVTGKDGYNAGILGFLGSGPHSEFANPEVNAYIIPIDDMDSQPMVADYEPGSSWHTYRIEVEGPRVSFFIDGLRKSFAVSSQTNFLSGGPIQFKAAKAIIRMDSIRILAL